MSDIADNGGTAFPVEGQGAFGPITKSAGMSLRDYFAGQALMSLPHLCAHDTLLGGMTFEQHIARNAYKLADAMLATRQDGAA